MRASRLKREQAAEQILRRLADENSIWRRQCLKPRGEIGGFADDGALLRGTSTDDLADDNQSCGDADACLKPGTVRTLDAADFSQDADRGPDGAFSRILEGVRESEISENAVAHELGNEAAEPADRAGGGILITPDQTSQQFRIDGAR